MYFGQGMGREGKKKKGKKKAVSIANEIWFKIAVIHFLMKWLRCILHNQKYIREIKTFFNNNALLMRWNIENYTLAKFIRLDAINRAVEVTFPLPLLCFHKQSPEM